MFIFSHFIYGVIIVARTVKTILFLSIILFSSLSYSVDSVHVKGLFNKKAAVLIIDGEQVLLKIGRTKLGVTLIEATSRDAILMIDGKRQRVALSQQIGGSYKKPAVTEVRIQSQQGGHHWVQGQINGGSVRFVVDTGATTIAMNLSTARRLGIDYAAGEKAAVSTANGVKEARVVNLNKVTVGSITQYNVLATVSLDDALPVVLLGNSFLSGVDLRTENGVLILKAR